MKTRWMPAAAALAVVLALSGCGMKPEEAAAKVQESLDAAKESAEKDQALQDYILAEAGLDMQGLPAEGHAEALAGIRSACSLSASSAEKTKEGFSVTVDIAPADIAISEDAYQETFKKAVIAAKDAGIPFSGLTEAELAPYLADALLPLAAEGAAQSADTLQKTVAVTKDGEVDAEAVSAIMDEMVRVTWPEKPDDLLDYTKMESYFDLPGTYTAYQDLTDVVKAEVGKSLTLELTGSVGMEMVLTLKEDGSMTFGADLDAYEKVVRGFYDQNLDALLKYAGATLEQYEQFYQLSSREEVLDKMIRDAGLAEGGAVRKQMEEQTVSGTWYVMGNSVCCSESNMEFEMQDDGSFLYKESDLELNLVKKTD